METPATMRRVTRSQSAALLKKSKMQEEVPAKRQPLFDITNDSPIASSLTTKETPTKHITFSIKAGATDKLKPLSGESVLQCQVQTLVQKDEQEKEGGLVGMADKVVSSYSKKEGELNPTLLFDDTPNKPELTDIGSNKSSARAFMDNCNDHDLVSFSDDDCSSVWSLQVNASSEKEELDVAIEEESEDHAKEDEDEELLFDLCKGMNGMCIEEERNSRKCGNLPSFWGKHTKFVYNSEDEIEEHVIVLRGLPAPEGTHVRFRYEDDEC